MGPQNTHHSSILNKRRFPMAVLLAVWVSRDQASWVFDDEPPGGADNMEAYWCHGVQKIGIS